MALQVKAESEHRFEVKPEANELLAALSYMTDVVPDGCNYHSWQVALVGRCLASIIAPTIERDVYSIS